MATVCVSVEGNVIWSLLDRLVALCSRFCCCRTSVRGSSQVASVLDLIGGSSRSTTPSLVTRKSPTVDQGVQVNQPGSTPIKDDRKPQQQLSAQSRQMQPPHAARDGSVVAMFALLICSCLYSQFARLCFLVLQASEQDCCRPAAAVSSSAAEGAARQRTSTPQRTSVPWPTASMIPYDSIFLFCYHSERHSSPPQCLTKTVWNLGSLFCKSVSVSTFQSIC
jgi:hypothetical protein